MNLYDVECQDSKLRLLILLLQSAIELQKLADELLWRTNYTSLVQLVALKALQLNGHLSNTELAEWTQTARHNITALVKRMQEASMIEVWKEGVFVAGIYPHQDGIRIISKYMTGVYQEREDGPPGAVASAAVVRLSSPGVTDETGAIKA